MKYFQWRSPVRPKMNRCWGIIYMVFTILRLSARQHCGYSPCLVLVLESPRFFPRLIKWDPKRREWFDTNNFPFRKAFAQVVGCHARCANHDTDLLGGGKDCLFCRCGSLLVGEMLDPHTLV